MHSGGILLVSATWLVDTLTRRRFDVLFCRRVNMLYGFLPTFDHSA
jgi:hypothetical protein